MMPGLLWFDNSPKTEFTEKVKEAASYYQKKYGRKPDLCYVHPSMLAQKEFHTNGIEIRGAQQILPNHFWLGILEAAQLHQ
jgi:hypothetical protein